MGWWMDRWQVAGVAALVAVVVVLGLLATSSQEPTPCQRWQSEYREASRGAADLPLGGYRVPPPELEEVFEVAERRPGQCPFP